jgi:endonuclease/exonuclease/phosphatase family metal-dependent hydrolase
VRILTYNIYLGGTGRLEPIYTVLAHVQADIISLTEADDPVLVAALAQRLELHHVWAEGSGDRHIATLSRFPIRRWQIHRTPPLTQAVLETELDLARGPLSIYNVHLLPYLLLPFELRRWQAVGRLLALIRARPPGPHLILGDLNAIGPGDRVLQRRNPPRMRRLMLLQLGLIFRLAVPRLLKAGYVDCFRHLHPTADGFTWMPGNPTTRYDYILADSHLLPALRACRVVDELPAVQQASDHFPLLAEFDLDHL